MKKFNFLILFLFASFFTSFSQVPGIFNYQAVVRNASGELITDQDVTFRISILQDSETGTPVYVETHTFTTNAFGLANLRIGQGTVVSGLFLPSGWGANTHFIKVEIDPTGGNSFDFLGTSQLLSVPYAFHAQTVAEDQINDADADPLNELQTLSISGNDLSISAGNTVALPAASCLWTENGSNIYRSSGKVGIGTDNPEAILDVRSTESNVLGIFTQSSGWSIQANSNGADSRSIMAISNGGTSVVAEANGIGSAKLCSTEDNAAGFFNGNVYMMTGNVGIGTISPAAPLHVSSNLTPTLILSSTTTNSPDRPGIQFKNNTSQFISGDDGSDEVFGFYSIWANTRKYNAKLRVYGEALSNWGNYIELSHDGTDGIINTDVGDIVLAANTQKVGINTSLPTVSLDVNGNARVRSIPSGTGTYAIVVGEDGTFSKTSSDIRLKENISTLQNSLDKVLQLRGVNFTWKANPEYGTRIGFIAQEFEKVIPELVFTNEVDGYKGINYAEISSVLVEAIKEQQKIIDAMKAENEQLREQSKQLEIRLSQIESMLKISVSK